MAKSTTSELDKDVQGKGDTRDNRQRKAMMSTAGIEVVRRVVNRLKPYELSQSQRLLTYQAMLQDADVFTPYFANIAMVEKAFNNYQIEFNKHSPKSEETSDFMHYCVEVMLQQTPRTMAGLATSFKMNRVAMFEKSWSKGEDVKYKDYWCLSNLRYIDPLTLDTEIPFTIRKEGNVIQSIRQRVNAFKNSGDDFNFNANQGVNGFIYVPANKVCFVSDSGSDLQPFGTSTFDAIYSEWRFKTLLKDLTLTGVSRDFSGMPVLRLPAWLNEGANADPTGWEAKFLNDLTEDMMNMHNSDSSYISLPSDPHETSNTMKEFDIEFLGVQGGGRNFDVLSLMDQSKKAIYNAFGASNLLSGESGGSYNLIEGQNSIHSHFIKRDIMIIEEAWNKNIWKQTFKLNGFNLDWKDIPKFKAGEIEPVSLDELGKFIQRAASVGFLPIVPEVVNDILSKGGIPYQVSEDMTSEELREIMSSYESNAGQGDGTSGTGDSQQGGISSTTNSDNAA